MIKFIKKKFFIAISFVAMIILAMFALCAPTAKAAAYKAYKELTLQDILDTEISPQRSGSKDVWSWTGMKSKTTSNFTVDSSFSRFGIKAKSTTDNKMKLLSKVEYNFTINTTGTIQVDYGWDDYEQNYSSGTNSGTFILNDMDETEIQIYINIPSDAVISSFNMKLYYADTFTASVTAGSGIKEVYLSHLDNGRKRHEDSYSFKDGATVYSYVGVNYGYAADSSWVYMFDTFDDDYNQMSVYRVDSMKISGAAINFGTYTAKKLDPKTITLDNNGGSGSGSVSITYDEATEISSNGFSKTNSTFNGWNTKADGTGYSYSTSLSSSDTNSLYNSGATTLYAQWILASNIQNVVDLIDAIGIVTLDSEETIVAARSAYDALLDTENVSVTNYATLTAAEARLEEIKTNNATGDNVKSLIDEIGEVAYPASGNKINAARSAYDALTNDEQRVRVTNYATLTVAETAYEELKVNGANAVSNMINNLGEITLDSEDEIVAARSAYDALTEEQKALITTEVCEKLTSAEATLKSIHDQIAADAVKELIANIGDVEYSEAIKNKLDTANTRYEALTYDQKVLVTNYNELETKTNIYVRVEAVYVLIDSINNVKYNDSCKESINKAREAYDSLSDDEKKLVINYNELETKTNIYDRVEAVYVLIDSINNVKYNNSCKESINEAREAYDSLSDDEKELVINYNKLTKAETKYNDLKNDHEVFVGWMIALGIILGIILVLGIVYILFFFVFNKWIVIDEKPVRVFRIGKKNDNVRLLKMTFMVIYRDEEAIFNKKEDIK